MTPKEIFEELAKSDMKWYTIGGQIRIRRDETDRCFCPITLVCFRKTGKYYPVRAWKMAAKDIGLHPSSARNIINAADCDASYMPDRIINYRVKIKKAVGLE